MAWQRKSSDSCFFCFPASSLTPCPQAKSYLLQIIHVKSSAQKWQGCLPPWLHARDNDLNPNEDQRVPDFVLHQMCHTPIVIWFCSVCLHESQMIWTAPGTWNTNFASRMVIALFWSPKFVLKCMDGDAVSRRDLISFIDNWCIDMHFPDSNVKTFKEFRTQYILSGCQRHYFMTGFSLYAGGWGVSEVILTQSSCFYFIFSPFQTDYVHSHW